MNIIIVQSCNCIFNTYFNTPFLGSSWVHIFVKLTGQHGLTSVNMDVQVLTSHFIVDVLWLFERYLHCIDSAGGRWSVTDVAATFLIHVELCSSKYNCLCLLRVGIRYSLLTVSTEMIPRTLFCRQCFIHMCIHNKQQTHLNKVVNEVM